MKRLMTSIEHEKHGLIPVTASNSRDFRENMSVDVRKRLTLASMVVVMAKPPGRPEKMLERDLDESWHAPAQSAAPAFTGTD